MGISKYLTPTSRSSIFLYLCLRGLQISACSIAGFNFCYIIWQHNNHFCADNGSCTPAQKEEAKVPYVYIALVTMIVASILAAFINGFTHLSSILNALTGYTPFPLYPISLNDPILASNTPPEEKPTIPIIQALKNATHSTNNTALLVDAFILVIFISAFNEYTWHVVWGPVIPYCYLFKQQYGCGYGYYDYWKNLKVIDKECIISQCAWASSLFAMGFGLLIIALEWYYLKCEWLEELGVEDLAGGFEVPVKDARKDSTT